MCPARDSVAWELKAYAQHSLGRENDAINTLRSLVKHNPQQHHLLHMAAFRSAAGEDAGQTIQSAKTALDRSAGIGFKRAAHLATALALENSSIEYEPPMAALNFRS